MNRLLEAGACLTTKNQLGSTPLDLSMPHIPVFFTLKAPLIAHPSVLSVFLPYLDGIDFRPMQDGVCKNREIFSLIEQNDDVALIQAILLNNPKQFTHADIQCIFDYLMFEISPDRLSTWCGLVSLLLGGVPGLPLPILNLDPAKFKKYHAIIRGISAQVEVAARAPSYLNFLSQHSIFSWPVMINEQQHVLRCAIVHKDFFRILLLCVATKLDKPTLSILPIELWHKIFIIFAMNVPTLNALRELHTCVAPSRRN